MKFSGPELVRILMTLVTLIAVIFLAKPCGKQVSNFVMGYGSGSGSASSPKPGTVEPPPPENIDQYEQLKPGMSEQEIKAAIERSKARNAQVPPTPAGSAAVPAPAGSAAVSPGAVPAATGSAASPRAGSAQR